MGSLGLYRGELDIPDSSGRKRDMHVLIRETELLRFSVSLCNTAFCSGFVEHSLPVSCMLQVYSGGVSQAGRTATSHIPGIIIWDTFVRGGNPTLSTLRGLGGQGPGVLSNSETGEGEQDDVAQQ